MTETIEKLIIQAKNYIEADSKERQSNSADFNIFKITGIQSDEVKMCRMLAEIINPSGTNKKAMFFLKSFIEQVLEIKTMYEEELASAKVYTEYHTKTDRRIDIAIVTNKRFIPIEVKIYAKDQTNIILGSFLQYLPQALFDSSLQAAAQIRRYGLSALLFPFPQNLSLKSFWSTRSGCFPPLCCGSRIWCNPVHRQARLQARFQAFLQPLS